MWREALARDVNSAFDEMKSALVEVEESSIRSEWLGILPATDLANIPKSKQPLVGLYLLVNWGRKSPPPHHNIEPPVPSEIAARILEHALWMRKEGYRPQLGVCSLTTASLQPSGNVDES